MLRFVLLLVFALNPQQDPNINLLAIQVGTGILIVLAWVSGGVYKNWCLDTLEGSFALNLIILAAATMYTYRVSRQDGTQLAVGYISVSIALAIFITILAFQLGNVTGITQYFNTKCTALKRCIISIGDEEVEIESDTDSLPDRLINAIQYEPVPQTAQEHTAAEPTGSNVTRMLIPVYTP